MIISPIGYRGSKRVAMPHLEFIEGDLFVDVFGGSGTVVMNQEGSRVYNDIDPALCRFMVLLRDDPHFILENLKFYLHAREEWEVCAMEPTDPIKWFVTMQMSHGCSGESWGRDLRNNSVITTLYETKKEKILSASHALKGVVIENSDYTVVFRKYDSPDTVFYLDPPYNETHISYQTIDHVRFLNAVFNLKGVAYVSGYPSALYAKYPWDDQKEWRQRANIVHKKTVTATECLWFKDRS